LVTDIEGERSLGSKSCPPLGKGLGFGRARVVGRSVPERSKSRGLSPSERSWLTERVAAAGLASEGKGVEAMATMAKIIVGTISEVLNLFKAYLT
jgi:hypothetical protein